MYLCVCTFIFSYLCVCMYLHGGMSVRCLCVCAYMGTDQLSVYLGDTISGYHVIAYDKLRVSYDNNDTRVPFPRMSKLIQVHIWRVSPKLQLSVTECPPPNQPLSLTKGKTPALPNINIFLSLQAKLLYNKNKITLLYADFKLFTFIAPTFLYASKVQKAGIHGP